MAKKVPLSTMLVLILIVILMTFSVTYLSLNNKYSQKLNEIMSSYSVYDKINDIEAVIHANYIGEVDSATLQDSVMSGYIAGIGDKYAQYFSAEEYQDWQLSQNGSSVGIGVSVIYDESSTAIEIVQILPESPAEKAGLALGDLIVEIAGQKVSDIGYTAAKELMKGEEGSEITFSVIRSMSQQLTFTVTRAKVATLSVTGHMYSTPEGASTDIGVIRISGFDATTPDQFKAAVKTLQESGAVSFVFDLRNNPGGELSSVTGILDYLLPEGPIVHLTDKAGNTTTQSSDADCLGAKYAVLVNKNTASAAELFTCALKDYAQKGTVSAKVIGVNTYGKGTAQTVFRLNDNSAISISTKKYDPPYSENYEGIGITPDYEVELSAEAQAVNFYKLTDAMDNQLIFAVSILAAD